MFEELDLFDAKLEEDELTQYGVLGMKWGKRKKKSAAKSKPKPLTPQEKKDRELKRSKKLTNEEVQAKMDRMKLDKEFESMLNEKYGTTMKAKPAQVEKTKIAIDGNKIVNDILTGTITSVGKQLLNQVAGDAVNKALGFDVIKVAKKSVDSAKEKDE